MDDVIQLNLLKFLENENIFRKEYVFIKLSDKKIRNYFIKNWSDSFFVNDFDCDGIILDDIKDNKIENYLNKWIYDINLEKNMEYLMKICKEKNYEIKWYGVEDKYNKGLFMIFEKNI